MITSTETYARIAQLLVLNDFPSCCCATMGDLEAAASSKFLFSRTLY